MSADDPKRRLSVHDVIGALGDLPEGEDCVSVIRKQRDAADRPSVTDNARAEAIKDAAAWLDRLYPNGLIAKKSVLADLAEWADRAKRGLRASGREWAADRAETTTDNARAEAVEALKAHLTDRYVDHDAEEIAWNVLNIAADMWSEQEAAGRAETTTGAIARGEALAAGDPDWMNVTRWPQPETTTWNSEDYDDITADRERVTEALQKARRAETTTATTEDALDSLPYFTFEDDDVAPDEEFVRKADVARLLATARTRPTREQIARALREGRTNGLCKPGVRCNLCDCAQEYEDDLALRDADAVLDLLRDGAR